MIRNKAHLLSDLLAEETDPGFREALLNRTLVTVRHRRRVRKLQRAGAMIAILAGIVITGWRQSPPPAAIPVPAKSYVVVRTERLPAAAQVATQPLRPADVVHTVSGVSLVATQAAEPGWRQLSDDDLLALVGPTPAALVGHGPGSAELVFLNPADQDIWIQN